MVNEMRRKDRQLSEDEAMEILKSGEFGILSTIEQEYPYGVPVNYAVEDHSIYIHCSAAGGLKTENIKANCNVCFTVVGRTAVLSSQFAEQYESAIAFGKAEIIHGVEKEQALSALIDKYSAEFKEAGMKYIQNAKDQTLVYRIAIEHLTGKAHR